MPSLSKSLSLYSIIVGWLIFFVTARAAEVRRAPDQVLKGGQKVYLLDAREGAEAIAQDEPAPFFSILTTLDMSIRRGTALDERNDAHNRQAFKEYVKQSVRDWRPEEKKALLVLLERAADLCEKSIPALIPRQWYFIKTTGQEEGGAPYTRGPCIVLPENEVGRLQTRAGDEQSLRVVLHETFHVYSRLNPQRRAALYGCIGFHKDGEVDLGGWLAHRRITNPDGSDYDWRITLKNAQGKSIEAVLVVYSKEEKFRQDQPGLFSCVNFDLFEVRPDTGKWVVVTNAAGEPSPIDPQRADGFFEQVGRNTSYIIHPDEILADNAVMLAAPAGNGSSQPTARSPQILEKLRKVMSASDAPLH